MPRPINKLDIDIEVDLSELIYRYVKGRKPGKRKRKRRERKKEKMSNISVSATDHDEDTNTSTSTEKNNNSVGRILRGTLLFTAIALGCFVLLRNSVNRLSFLPIYSNHASSYIGATSSSSSSQVIVLYSLLFLNSS